MRILISHSLDWVKANMAEWSKVYGEDWLAIKDEKVISVTCFFHYGVWRWHICLC